MHARTILWMTITLCFVQCNSLPCAWRSYGAERIVCVCNATYCDTLERTRSPPDVGTAYVTTSTKFGERFNFSAIQFHANSSETNSIDEVRVSVEIDTSQTFQEVLGFGGAFTDSSGINFRSLPESMRYNIINSYFSINGSEYNMARVPMASTDFSTRPYSYDDHEGDFQLQHFQLAPEDYDLKIPFIQKALEISTEPLLLFGTPWAPPAWMKTNNKMENGGVLKGQVAGEYYETWANYFVKFLQAYEEQNIAFWGLTVQNEPSMGFQPNYSWQCLGLTAETEKAFVAENLGPALRGAGYGPEKLKLMIMDDQRVLLPIWPKKVLSNETVNQYVSGIAFHWYMNFLSPPRLLDLTHKAFPDKFLLATEACEGSYPWQTKVILGEWGRAETYAHDIIQDLQHWTAGWIDWNLALDLQGGPNWVLNFVDSPIIVNATAGEFYKQPMYYALAHFSKFIKRGSRRVLAELSFEDKNLEVVAFISPQQERVLVVLNRNSYPITMNIKEKDSNSSLQNVLQPNSIQTYLWVSQGTKDEL